MMGLFYFIFFPISRFWEKENQGAYESCIDPDGQRFMH